MEIVKCKNISHDLMKIDGECCKLSISNASGVMPGIFVVYTQENLETFLKKDSKDCGICFTSMTVPFQCPHMMSHISICIPMDDKIDQLSVSFTTIDLSNEITEKVVTYSIDPEDCYPSEADEKEVSGSEDSAISEEESHKSTKKEDKVSWYSLEVDFPELVVKCELKSEEQICVEKILFLVASEEEDAFKKKYSRKLRRVNEHWESILQEMEEERKPKEDPIEDKDSKSESTSEYSTSREAVEKPKLVETKSPEKAPKSEEESEKVEKKPEISEDSSHSSEGKKVSDSKKPKRIKQVISTEEHPREPSFDAVKRVETMKPSACCVIV
ncbi:hypothetical protein ADUPG1_012893 [Aduncisulcus paluster]|uniref:Uncharacterized protein n=1 Tax=Aduncisulcus paluster TaxID=2918883 RepID=A0ABQ5K111_9EUKA|nr:hypothetical protein ADUPG1_012893 [Aduncisulcus paluster]